MAQGRKIEFFSGNEIGADSPFAPPCTKAHELAHHLNALNAELLRVHALPLVPARIGISQQDFGRLHGVSVTVPREQAEKLLQAERKRTRAQLCEVIAVIQTRLSDLLSEASEA